ncbi:MAG: GTP-binding protein, partial [Cyanobacteria bacterium]|nr:GTP-binding protein [Cyanobacteria bacterium CG_2015-09_32_10]
NKTDLVDEADVDLLEVRLRDIKADARILRTTKSQVPLPLILSVGLFESDKYFDTIDSDDKHDHHDHDHHHHEHNHHCTEDHEHDEHCHHDHHNHSNHLENDGFISVSFVSDKPFNMRKLQSFLDNELSANVFRAKGILWFQESPDKHIFHLSGKRFTIEDDVWKEGQKRENKLVFIGQNIEAEIIKSQLEKCLINN